MLNQLRRRADALIGSFPGTAIDDADRNIEHIVRAGLPASDRPCVGQPVATSGCSRVNFDDFGVGLHELDGAAQNLRMADHQRPSNRMDFRVRPGRGDHLRADTGHVTHGDCESRLGFSRHGVKGVGGVVETGQRIR